MGDEQGLIGVVRRGITAGGLIDRIGQSLCADEQPRSFAAEIGVESAVEADGGDPLLPGCTDVVVDGDGEGPPAGSELPVRTLLPAGEGVADPELDVLGVGGGHLGDEGIDDPIPQSLVRIGQIQRRGGSAEPGEVPFPRHHGGTLRTHAHQHGFEDAVPAMSGEISDGQLGGTQIGELERAGFRVDEDEQIGHAVPPKSRPRA